MSDTKSKFDSAANFIKGFNPSKPIPDNEKLVTYSLFKQSTVGNVNIERPGVLNLEVWCSAYSRVKQNGMPGTTEKECQQKKQWINTLNMLNV